MSSITQDMLDDFKRENVNNKNIQDLTLDEIINNTREMTVDWSRIDLISAERDVQSADEVEALLSKYSACELAVATVIVDVVLLALGAISLRKMVGVRTLVDVFEAARPVVSETRLAIAKIIAPGASKKDIAKGVFSILSVIKRGGCLGAIVTAIISKLKWYQMVLYGITGMATITAIATTGGAAFVAEVIVLLVSATFFVEDAIAAASACSIVPDPTPQPGPEPQPQPNPFPNGPIAALQTKNGFYLTVINNGGLGENVAKDAAIQTDRTEVGTWEKFRLIPLESSEHTFALQTLSGFYLSATNCGGMSGPSGQSDTSCPIQTDRTLIGEWEKLRFEDQGDGTYAISTTTGYYLTAVNGGGVTKNFGHVPVCTSETGAGNWETFKLIPIIPN